MSAYIIRSIVLCVIALVIGLVMGATMVQAASPYKPGKRFHFASNAVVIICNADDEDAAHDYDRYTGMFEFVQANIGDSVLADRTGSDPALARAVLRGRDALLEEVNRRHPHAQCHARDGGGIVPNLANGKGPAIGVEKGETITRFQYEREIGFVDAGNGLWIRLHEAMPVERWVPEREEWQSLRQPNDAIIFFDGSTIEEDNPGALSPQTIQAVQAQLYEWNAYNLNDIGVGTLVAVADGKWGAKSQRAFERAKSKDQVRLDATSVFSLFYGIPRHWRGEWLAVWWTANDYGRPSFAGTRTEAAERVWRECSGRRRCGVLSAPGHFFVVMARCEARGRGRGKGVYVTSSSQSAAIARDELWAYVRRPDKLGQSARCEEPSVFGGEQHTGSTK